MEKPMYIGSPVKWRVVTQGFGMTNPYIDYKKMGLRGHDAQDLRADINTPLLACFDGTVKDEGVNPGDGGHYIKIWSPEVNRKRYGAMYYHINKSLVKKGDSVTKGQVIGYSGNTGKFTTGAHLHFKFYKYKKVKNEWLRANYNNGYRGGLDPQPYYEDRGESWLPVDERFGREQQYWAEFKMRFKVPFLHRYLKKLGRDPLSLTQRELFALVYGGWGVEEVFDPAYYPLWNTLKKSDYKNKVKPPIRLTL